MSERICPRCTNPYTEHGATSRADDRTEICPTCGVDEALRAAAGQPIPPVSEWPTEVIFFDSTTFPAAIADHPIVERTFRRVQWISEPDDRDLLLRLGNERTGRVVSVWTVAPSALADPEAESDIVVVSDTELAVLFREELVRRHLDQRTADGKTPAEAIGETIQAIVDVILDEVSGFLAGDD